MTPFVCSCGNTLYFDNTRCVGCGATVGFCKTGEQIELVSIPNDAKGTPKFRACANAAKGLCNWFVRADSEEQLCASCEMSRVVPDLSNPQNVAKLAVIEAAKRRLIFNLSRLGLNVVSKTHDPEKGLVFEIRQSVGEERVITGHAAGVITIDVDEADPVNLERQRCQLRENYRTVLGHLRHETGHYYFDRLIADRSVHEAFRAVFGDERSDYALALQTHYANGGNPNWQATFISEYASSHPWEDWAETWAHYLHCHATSETARSKGFRSSDAAVEKATADFLQGSRKREDFDAFLKFWEEAAILLNEMNRSMGVSEAYPFQLTQVVTDKLFFVHQTIRGADTQALRAA